MHDGLTATLGIETALSPGCDGEPSEGEASNCDATALTAEHLRLVQLGHSGPAWLGLVLWDGMYMVSILGGAWNGAVSVPKTQPVRAAAHCWGGEA